MYIEGFEQEFVELRSVPYQQVFLIQEISRVKIVREKGVYIPFHHSLPPPLDDSITDPFTSKQPCPSCTG